MGNIKEFFKRNLLTLSIIVVLAIIGLAAVVATVMIRTRANEQISTKQTNNTAQGTVILPCNGEGRFNVHDKNLYYQYQNRYCFIVEGGDSATFEVLGFGFARDKNAVFYQGRKIADSDSKTFQALAEGYAKDASHVYFFNPSRDFSSNKIEGADPKTFTVLSSWFGKDNKTGYYGWNPIANSDGATFQVIKTEPISDTSVMGFSKDKVHVFLNDKLINGADPKTFQVYTNLVYNEWHGFSRDSMHVFWGDQMIAGADPVSFQLVETTSTLGMCQPYFKDKSHVFSGTQMLEGSDPNTFKYIGQLIGTPVLYNESCLATDKNNAYIDSAKIPNVDAQSLQVLGIYLKDKYHVYLGTTELIGADAATFGLIGEGSVSAKDKNAVYECGQSVMPNKNNFKLLGDFYGKTDFQVYYKNQVLTGADAKTFSTLGGSGVLNCESSDGGYAKDKSHVYFAGKIIQGADPQSFKLNFEIGIAQDRNGEYRMGVKVPNDFVMCSTSTDDLPGGVATWQSKLPSLGSDTSTALFEFCVMPNQDKLIGYKPNSEVEAKTIIWFDSKNQLVNTINLDCSSLGTVLPQSIRALNGSTVTLTCLAQDACTSRVFYELNLDQWRTSSSSVLRKTDESYDCGYRG